MEFWCDTGKFCLNWLWEVVINILGGQKGGRRSAAHKKQQEEKQRSRIKRNKGKVGLPKGGGFERWEPYGWEAQNFALLFPSPATNSLFLSLWGVFSCHFGGVIVVLGLSCEAPFAVEGGPAVGGPAVGVESGERPKFWSTQENFKHIPHQHTTTRLNSTTTHPHPQPGDRSWATGGEG